MKLFVCIVDDARLLPHFLRHYEPLGVTEFHIAAPRNLAGLIAGASHNYKVIQHHDFDAAASFTGGADAVTAMREFVQGDEEWVVIVDLDEFVELRESLIDLVGKIEAEGGNIARGVMYDRFAIDGQLPDFDDESELPLLFPVRARFRRVVMGGNEIKGVLVKGRLKSLAAHHKFHDERPYSKMLEISHYKWNDRALYRTRLARDMCLAANSPWDFDGEFKRVLDHYEQHGRFAWETFGGEIVGPVPEISKAPAPKRNWMRRFLARASGARKEKIDAH